MTANETDPLAVEAQVCLTVSAAARSLVGFYRPLLAPLGLTHPQYLAMLALWQYGPISLTELAGHLHLDPATASPLVRRLEAMGLLRRERDPVDERALLLVLTDKGRELRSQAVPIPATMVERLGLEPAQIEEIRRAAELLVAACTAAS